MLRCVARRVERGEPERPDVERLAVADRCVVVGKLGAGADHLPGARERRQVAAAGDVIVVEMGLDHVRDPEVLLTGGGEVDVDVSPGVDDRRGAARLVGDQGRQVAEPLDPELADQHRPERTTASDAVRPATIEP